MQSESDEARRHRSLDVLDVQSEGAEESIGNEA